jgi:hypothetical protein
MMNEEFDLEAFQMAASIRENHMRLEIQSLEARLESMTERFNEAMNQVGNLKKKQV